MRSHLSITAAALLLPALAFSQTPGQYETYGSSCGTVGQTFAGHNPNGSTSYGTLPNEYALPFTLANPAPVSGMGFWTSVDSAAAKKVYSVIARIYDTDTAGAPNQVLAETMLTVGSTLRVWSCQLESTLVLQPGNYFASYEPYEPGTSTTVLNSPETTDGTNQLTTKAYWRRPSGTSYTAWAATGIVDSPWFEIHRAGVNAPVLSNTGVPEISKSFSVDLSGAPVGRPVLSVLGLSNSTFGPIPLPLNLSALSESCWLWASLDIMVPTAADNNGDASVKWTLPNDKNFIGANIYNQYIIVAPGTTPAGLLFTNGGVGTIGG